MTISTEQTENVVDASLLDDIDNSNRPAHASIRGYYYQLVWTARQWLKLPPSAYLVVEGQEDLDFILPGPDGYNQYTQIKDLNTAQNFRSTDVRESVWNFLLAFRGNTEQGREARYLFLTSARRKSQRQGNDLILNDDILSEWQRIHQVAPEQLGTVVEKVKAGIKATLAHLQGASNEPSPVPQTPDAQSADALSDDDDSVSEEVEEAGDSHAAPANEAEVVDPAVNETGAAAEDLGGTGVTDLERNDPAHEAGEQSEDRENDLSAAQTRLAAASAAIEWLDEDQTRWPEFLKSVTWTFQEPDLAAQTQLLFEEVAVDERTLSLPPRTLAYSLIYQVCFRSTHPSASERVLTASGITQETSRTAEDLEIWAESVGLVRLELLDQFDLDWMQERFDMTRAAVGPRYQPQLHVDVEEIQSLAAFGRTTAFVNDVRSGGHTVAAIFNSTISSLRGVSSDMSRHTEEWRLEIAQTSDRLAARLRQDRDSVLALYEAYHCPPVGPSNVTTLVSPLADSKSWISLELDSVNIEEARNLAESGQRRRTLWRLTNILREAVWSLQSEIRRLVQLRDYSNSNAVAIVGAAGLGKTHLLCDATENRLADGAPTVMILGQALRGAEDPLGQILQSLDLRYHSTKNFVDALEAAAVASNKRAVVFIDALNESHPGLWQGSLPTLIAEITSSNWISVAISVRLAYEQTILAQAGLTDLHRIWVRGFEGLETSAMERIFSAHGIETISSPVVASEYSNPLFLIILSRALLAAGRTSIPRGGLGIREAFNLYIDGANLRLSGQMQDQSTHLIVDTVRTRPVVRKALRRLVQAMLLKGARHLFDLEAEAVCREVETEYSWAGLYSGMISEGLLVTTPAWDDEGDPINIVSIVFDRLADHLFATLLLEEPNADDALRQVRLHPGVLVALCIEAPEGHGAEVFDLLPELRDVSFAAESQMQSVVWRDPASLPDNHSDLFTWDPTKLPSEGTFIDVLLTVSHAPQHPYNAIYLHNLLSSQSMAVRDAWWTTGIARLWTTGASITRLIRWSLSHGSVRGDGIIPDLAGRTLSWLLTTSSRQLRDSATRALVRLFEGDLAGAKANLDLFLAVDAPYVVERVMASVCGVVLRQRNLAETESLAQHLLDLFEARSIPQHILTRDYARVILEYAHELGCNVDQDAAVRPWHISRLGETPSPEEIAGLRLRSEDEGFDGMRPEWSRARIFSSVLRGDFARYTIGTNGATAWLSRTVEEPVWRSEQGWVRELEQLEGACDPTLSGLLRSYLDARKEYAEVLHLRQFAALSRQVPRLDEIATWTESEITDEVVAEHRQHQTETLSAVRQAGLEANANEVVRALDRLQHDDEVARLDLSGVQRRILKRVFSLGWSTERFGCFDRFFAQDHRSHPACVERIGKKYQRVALHEVWTELADNFQYAEGGEGLRYPGPWVDHLRDFDPTMGGTQDAEVPVYSGVTPPNWGPDSEDDAWIDSEESNPDVSGLLVLRDEGETEWIVVNGDASWAEATPPYTSRWDVRHREVWLGVFGFLVRQEDVESFLNWAAGVDFWGRWMPEARQLTGVFLGEVDWARSVKSAEDDADWVVPDNGCPCEVHCVSARYLNEWPSYVDPDDARNSIELPTAIVQLGMGLARSRQDGILSDSSGEVLAVGGSLGSNFSGLAIRRSELVDFLNQEKLALCWAMLSEKRVVGGAREDPGPRQTLTGFAHLAEQLSFVMSIPPKESGSGARGLQE